MRVFSATDFKTGDRRYDKWNFLAIRHGYVGVCDRGCHGQEASTYDFAIEAGKIAQKQCDAEHAGDW